MNCPNCNHGKLDTIKTYQDVTRTIRYKECPACKWKFTSLEVIPDEHIPMTNKVRRHKK